MSSEDSTAGGRISVSRDALRAELAEFKLQLLGELRDELDRKASRAVVEALDVRVSSLERQNADTRAVNVHNEELFSKREKLIGLWIAGGGLTLAALTMVLAGHWP